MSNPQAGAWGLSALLFSPSLVALATREWRTFGKRKFSMDCREKMRYLLFHRNLDAAQNSTWMSKRFIGIGVAQGDAFFLELEDGLTTLVDGGRSEDGFPRQFQRATKRDRVDVLVCTHNDADHANGILGFLQSGLGCNEVWLPASWTDRLDDLFLRPAQFTDELVKNIVKFAEENDRKLRREGKHLEQLGDDYAEEGRLDEGTESIETDLLVEHAVEGEIEEELGGPDWPCPFAWHPRWGKRWLREWPPGGRLFRLLLESIEAGERIRQIALLAYHRGCRIRWFEYTNAGAFGGIQGKLIPVNAREILRVRVKKWSALMYFALTVTNWQSLVFCSPQSNGPGILFTADSDLRFSSAIPWHHGIIVTAPHHGSEANAKAYARFQREMAPTSSSIWVRSDGRFKSRPGPSYLKLKARRFCTLCPSSLLAKQDVQFKLTGAGTWGPVGTRRCKCV